MFIDKVAIKIKAGDGGSGHVSFFRDKLNDKGGPDGGDGGKGGDIVFEASTSQNNLADFYYVKKYFAADGEKGGKKNCSGAAGKNLVIKVPLGTIIKDAASGNVLADMFYEGDNKTILRGGAGGKGNSFFATSRKQTPNFSQTGEKTKAYEVVLELKTIADVGLIGFPNVGKSTLLSMISNAKPKIANYHFTTLNPNLGVASFAGKNFVVADIPGLIEGAAEGAGLGHEFLRHIERTRLFVHIIDISGFEGRDPVSDFKIINNELIKYSKVLADVPQIIALNKCDLISDKTNIKAFEKQYGKKYTIIQISAATTSGLQDLLKAIVQVLDKIPAPKPVDVDEDFVLDVKDKTSISIEITKSGEFICTGGLINNLVRGVVLNDAESFGYFQRRLIKSGIIDLLKQKGVKNGDTVVMGEVEFEFVD